MERGLLAHHFSVMALRGLTVVSTRQPYSPIVIRRGEFGVADEGLGVVYLVRWQSGAACLVLAEHEGHLWTRIRWSSEWPPVWMMKLGI